MSAEQVDDLISEFGWRAVRDGTWREMLNQQQEENKTNDE